MKKFFTLIVAAVCVLSFAGISWAENKSTPAANPCAAGQPGEMKKEDEKKAAEKKAAEKKAAEKKAAAKKAAVKKEEKKAETPVAAGTEEKKEEKK